MASAAAEVGMMPPPEGVIPDFHHSTDVQHTFIVVFTITFGLATIALFLRVYTRFAIVKSPGLDEPIIVLSWGVALAFFITSLKTMPAGFGRHLWEVTQTQLLGYLNLLLVLALTYLWPPTLTKLAVLVLYWRINPSRIYRGCILATAFILVGYTATFTGLFIGPCNPLTSDGVCLNNIAIAQATLNIITDGVIIALPIPSIHRLNMPFKQKLTVGIILALGSAACIASIVRVAYVKAMNDNPDFTFTQCSAAVWSLLEINLGILCNCLATLKPFARRHMPCLFTLSSGPSGESSSYVKRSKNAWERVGGKGPNNSYRLHSVAKGGPHDDKMNATLGKDIVVVDQVTVEYDFGSRRGRMGGDGGSTDSILAPEHTGHRAV